TFECRCQRWAVKSNVLIHEVPSWTSNSESGAWHFERVLVSRVSQSRAGTIGKGWFVRVGWTADISGSHYCDDFADFSTNTMGPFTMTLSGLGSSRIRPES